MLYAKHVSAFALGLVVAVIPARSFAFDWSKAFSTAAEWSIEAIDKIDTLHKVKTAADAARFTDTLLKDGSAAVSIKPSPPVLPLQAVLFGYDTYQRQRELNISWSRAIAEQSVISLPSIGVTTALNTAMVACVGSGACEVSAPLLLAGAGIVGVGYEIKLIGKNIVEGYREYEGLLAAQQKVEELKARVAAEKLDKLRALRNTKQLRDKRSAQLAQPKPKATDKATANPPPATKSAAAPTSAKITSTPTTKTANTSTTKTTSTPTIKTTPAPAPYIYAKSVHSAAAPSPTAAAKALLTPAEIERLKTHAVALKPPPPPAPPPPAPIYVPVHATYTGFTAPRVGGVSLSLAAAMQMALKINLQGLYYENGRIVLAGPGDSDQTLDAALFFTALRLACESGEPYFSLDPDDGKAWLEEGDRAWIELMQQLRGHLALKQRNVTAAHRGLALEPFSAKRDYPQIWNRLIDRFPNLKTRLVFRPDWLRESRFGEILYKADVLLKELSSGAVALGSGSSPRAFAIEHYVSTSARRAARSLLAGLDHGMRADDSLRHKGMRLWFDLAPQSEAGARASEPDINSPLPPASGSRSPAAQLRQILLSRYFFRQDAAAPVHSASLVRDGKALDVSGIYPMMFVRIHDHALRKDIDGHDLDYDFLAADVNARPQRYASSYEELRALIKVFRAYVVAVAITRQDSTVCAKVRSHPLMASEKTPEALPQYHLSELSGMIGTFVYSNGTGTSGIRTVQGLISGGISLRGKTYFDVELKVDQQTLVTQDLKQAASADLDKGAWRGNSGRQFIALTIDSGEMAREVGERQRSRPATLQEVLTKQEEMREASERRSLDEEAAEKRKYEARLKEWELLQVKWKEAEAQWEQADRRWREAEQRWLEEERNATEAGERARLTAKYGPAVDSETAALALPYAVMCRDTYGGRPEDLADLGIRFVASWETILERAGYTEARIHTIKASGFHAAIYEHERTGEMTIAYRGAPAREGRETPGGQRASDIETQYKAAAELAALAKQAWPHIAISLGGHGLGGDLADFAGSEANIAKVITFNSAIPARATANGSRINIRWADRRS